MYVDYCRKRYQADCVPYWSNIKGDTIVNEIKGFQGEYRWLSNFWYAEVSLNPFSWRLTGKGILLPFNAPTNEHAYQALKMQFYDDARYILTLDTPGKAKRMARIRAMHADWGRIKLETMYHINLAKYSQHPMLLRKLIDTGDAYIEETNHWNDIFWGVCNGKGENHLGKIIMRIREELKQDIVHRIKAMEKRD